MPRHPRHPLQDSRSPAAPAEPAGANVGSPETRQRILDAARKVFSERGYVDTSVEHIITLCQVSRGTFYYYFRNKEDVFETLVRAAVDDLLAQAQTRVESDDPYVKIESRNRGYLEVFAQHRDILRNLFQVATIEPRFAQLHHEMRMRFISRIRRNLERNVAAGTCRPLDSAVVSYALGGMLDWFAYVWLGLGMIDEANMDIEQAARQLSEVWYHAIYGGRPHTGGVDGMGKA